MEGPSANPKKKGAVLLLLYVRDGEPNLVFTKRTEKVAIHKGQICFPGGSYEVYDASLLDTALRETVEEIGVDLSQVAIIARLEDELTVSTNFVVSPFVAFIANQPEFRPDPFEVAEVIEVPLRSLFDLSAWREEEHEYEGVPTKVPFFRHEQTEICGATARILRQFVEMYKNGKIVLPVVATG